MRTGTPFQAPALVQLTEADVRSLCRPAAFARGNAWQQADHVMEPIALPDSLNARVMGTWRRVDTVTATVAGNRVHTSCTCNQGEFCRHAAALLLHWIRRPASFAADVAVPSADLEDFDEYELDDEPAERIGESLQDEYARLLETDTMAHLREIARMREVRVVAKNKVEMVQGLVASLAAAADVDAVLATLSDDERITLDAADLLGSSNRQFSFNAFGAAYRALGGKETLHPLPPAVDTLVNLGLLFPTDRYSHPSAGYVVPRLVAARIPYAGSTVTRLLRPVAPVAGFTPDPDRAQLGPLEIFQIVVHELTEGRVGANPSSIPEEDLFAVPAGWRIGWRAEAMRNRVHAQTEVRLRPLPPLLSESDLHSLKERTGCPLPAIDFALELLAGLEIIEYSGRGKNVQLIAHADRLQQFLGLPPTTRAAWMLDAWLRLADSADFRNLTGREEQLKLHYMVHPYYSGWSQSQPRSSAARPLVLQLLARLSVAEDAGATWCSSVSVLELIWNLAPGLLGGSTPGAGEWWFSPGGQDGQRLDLGRRDEWERVWQPLIEAMLRGPLSWLGLVDVTVSEDGRLAFRLRPTAAILTAREPETEGDAVAAPLLFDLEPEAGTPAIVVPAGADGSVHTLMARIGVLVDASLHGLRYRLSPEKVKMSFDSGVTGPDLLGALEKHAGGGLPDGVRATLGGWWADYGKIRLYDDVTLIELDDDILLRELEATSSLKSALVASLSPRLIAIDPAKADRLVEDLTRLGYTPRVLEEA